jgi:hypothetical protein
MMHFFVRLGSSFCRKPKMLPGVQPMQDKNAGSINWQPAPQASLKQQQMKS